MDAFEKLMNNWEKILNADAELAERHKSPYSTIEGKAAIQLEVEKQPPYSVHVQDGKFSIQKGTADKPLLCWRVPGGVFKDVMLGKHRLIFSMLDPSVTLLFDSANFTHWNGATVIEMLLLAHEMIAQNKEISKIVEGLEC
ncbi:MAG: hypothetical protein JW832_14705 [Deltaproteobacteria bacterium]|nr:hypothetical protein [Deltaproteobacteria bacterium]